MKQPCAAEVHRQSIGGDGDRPIRADGYGIEQPKTDSYAIKSAIMASYECARKTRQLAAFPRTEDETFVVDMLPGEP